MTHPRPAKRKQQEHVEILRAARIINKLSENAIPVFARMAEQIQAAQKRQAELESMSFHERMAYENRDLMMRERKRR